jgi:hypothetical protein
MTRLDRRVLTAAVLVLFLLGASIDASAEEIWARPFAVHAMLGLGTPLGFGGLVVEYSPAPLVAVGLGIGLGYGTLNSDCREARGSGICSGPFADRVQVAVLSRLRVLRRGHKALFLGGGFNGGGYSWTELTTDQPAHKTADRAYWANAEIGLERRTRSGLSVAGFIGYSQMLNPGALVCVETISRPGHCPNSHRKDGDQLIYLGGSVGYAF